MTQALAVVPVPYFTFMRRFQIFPSICHIPGPLNLLADDLSRFKQPLSVDLDPAGFRDFDHLACLLPKTVESRLGISTSSIVKKNCGSPVTVG